MAKSKPFKVQATSSPVDLSLLEKHIIKEHCAAVEVEIRHAVDELAIACRNALERFKGFCKAYDLNISKDCVSQKDTAVRIDIAFDITPEQLFAKEKSTAIKNFLKKQGN